MELIIGHRGFVGSNLSIQIPQALGAGKAEIESMAGKQFSNIYCAAPQAQKWWANQNPMEDLDQVNQLIQSCCKLDCSDSFYLFSTVDVYDPPIEVTELDSPPSNSHSYGKHRYYLEQELLKVFESRLKIIRLPALVGIGLKKNVVFDLMNDKNVHLINPNSSFQWFNLDRLQEVIAIAHGINSQVLNVASEPLPTIDILHKWFPEACSRLNWDATPIIYDFRTIFGPDGSSYLYSKEEIINNHLTPFIEAGN
ncbi:MAG: hypothetical protein ACK5FE_04400 [Cyanobacteriota bacterium]|jgi:nucleoside-diphosphate-sugar epimerase